MSEKVGTKPFGGGSLFSDNEIKQIVSGTSLDIAKWVRATAVERKISRGLINRQLTQRFARAVSRLSDSEVDLDPVEELLVAMSKSGVITPFQRGLLQVHYLR